MQDSNYILGQVLARGGMAEVCRGLFIGQDGFRRLVAIKRVLPQFAENPEFAEMFRDEARIGQRLQHANVVKVEGYNVIENCPSIIMEFVDGSDLRSILAELERSKEIRRIPIPMALYIIAEAARGLHYAHTRRDDMTGRSLDIVHRDISPQNILVSFNGEVKVTDFGIASADSDFKNTETKAGIVKGKYSYMSPEQISAKKVDARTDVFALSIVLWEMLAMRRLFTAESEVEVIDLVKNCRINVNLREINKNVSPDLESVALRGLAKDVSRRFGSMDELERAIRAILSKEFPNFTVGDLSNMMKQALAARHEASQIEIKKLLSATNFRSEGKSLPSLELEVAVGDARNNTNLTVSRLPVARVVNVNQTQQPGPKTRLGSSTRARPKQNKKRPMMVAAVVVIAVIAAVFFKSQSKSAKDPLTTTLRSTPSTVQIKINGQPFMSGRHVKTPIRIKLTSGANFIEVSRAGYRAETIPVDTRRGQQRNIPAINLDPAASFATARFVLIGNDNTSINVNDGFASSALSQAQPVFEVKDLTSGATVDVLVEEKSKAAFRCRFAMPRINDKKPVIVGVDPVRNRCDLSVGKDRGDP